VIRPILIELVLFLTPFALYAVFLIATRAKVFERANWPSNRVFVLAVIAVFGGAPPGSTYEPAHVQNGKFVPGRTR
jgi:hypothetical protein